MATATPQGLAVSDLSPGERLFIWRHRKGVDQFEAARLKKTTYRVYGKWERDEVTIAPCPKGAVGSELTRLEKCLLLRRRAKITQRELAADMSVSTGWVKVLESGRSEYEDSLHSYWCV